jgi:hypothetical protein
MKRGKKKTKRKHTPYPSSVGTSYNREKKKKSTKACICLIAMYSGRRGRGSIRRYIYKKKGAKRNILKKKTHTHTHTNTHSNTHEHTHTHTHLIQNKEEKKERKKRKKYRKKQRNIKNERTKRRTKR